MQPLPNGMAQVPLPNGHGSIPQMPLKGVPQAPMQGIPGMSGMPGMPSMQGLPAQHRMPAPNPAPDIRLVMQARQISEQQRQAVQMQQQGQNAQIHNSPPNMRANMNMNGMNQQAFMQNNQAMMAAFNAGGMNGVSTPPANALNVPSVGPAGSPRMGHPSHAQQSNGSVSQITKLESQYRAQFPTASPEQINKLVRDALNQNLVAQRQSAMHAAAGNGAALPSMPGGIQNSPQQYAQMLRAQQERQAAAASQQTRSTSAGSGSGTGK
jgi:chromatin modification-related protein VID21